MRKFFFFFLKKKKKKKKKDFYIFPSFFFIFLVFESRLTSCTNERVALSVDSYNCESDLASEDKNDPPDRSKLFVIGWFFPRIKKKKKKKKTIQRFGGEVQKRKGREDLYPVKRVSPSLSLSGVSFALSGCQGAKQRSVEGAS